MHPSKNNRVFLKVLKPKLVAPAEYPKDHI